MQDVVIGFNQRFNFSSQFQIIDHESLSHPLYGFRPCRLRKANTLNSMILLRDFTEPRFTPIRSTMEINGRFRRWQCVLDRTLIVTVEMTRYGVEYQMEMLSRVCNSSGGLFT
jgi:hypothetical protein